MLSDSSARGRRASAHQDNGPARLAGLGNRFIELLGRKLSRRAFAIELATLVAEAARLKAVAVLGYERRREQLVLLADRGLRHEARAALGGGGPCAWDIPLRGLRNRRISVIEAAHQNPFVPPDLVNLSPGGLCVASIPIYYDYDPAAVVLLFVAGSHGFPDTQLQTLSQALRVCGRGLRDTESPLSRAVTAKPVDDGADEVLEALIDDVAADEPPAEARPAQLYLVESDKLREAEATAASDQAARVQQLQQELAQARAEIDRTNQALRKLTISGNELARERDALAQQLADLQQGREGGLSELRDEITALHERVLAVDSERARYQRVAEARHTSSQQTISTLEGERTALREQLQTAEATAADAQAMLDAVRKERDHLTAQGQALTSQVRAGEETLARAQERFAQESAALEGDRDRWKEQTGAVRGQLAQRSETLAMVERDLRSAVVARDASGTQLQAARAELERLTSLTEELGQTATQLEAARARAVAEGAALQRNLEDARANYQHLEQALRADTAAVQAEAEQRSADAETLRSELAARARVLAERDEQISVLQQEHAAVQHAHGDLQQNHATLRAELATLNARLEQGAHEQQQLGEERVALRAALAEARQQAKQLEAAHAAAVEQLLVETSALRQQLESLTGDRAGLAGRLERTQEEGKTLARQLGGTQQRVDELNELLRQRDATLVGAAAERQRLLAQGETLTGQLQASQEALERAHTRSVQERAAIEKDRDGWQEQATMARAELAQHADAVAALERELRSTTAARDAGLNELQAARTEIGQLSALTEELGQTATQLEVARAGAGAENASLRQMLAEERAGHLHAEQKLRNELAAGQAHAERLAAELSTQRREVTDRTRVIAERDEQLAGVRQELEGLRQQSADRGVLARQASELGSKVLELEQALAAVRGEADGAERQRAALAEQLQAARHQQTQAAAAASREQATLQAAVQRLTDERARLEGEKAAQGSESHGLRAALVELQTVVERERAEHHQQLALLRTENETLQQQSADRGVLAQQAGELNARVAELEQALAQARGETARADGQRATLAKELQSVRQRGADAIAAAQREQAGLQGALEQLGSARNRLEAETAEQGRELQAQRLTLAELQAAREREGVEHQEQLAALRAESVALQQHGVDRDALAQRAGELSQNLANLEQRLTAVRGEAARAERERAAVVRELEATRHQAAESASAAQREQVALQETLQRLTDERGRLEAAAAAYAAELEAQRRAIADLQTTLERERSEHEQQLAALHYEQDSARQAEIRWQQTTAELHADVATLTARLEQSAAEQQQLRDEREAVARQLELVVAARGEEAQALTQGLQASRTQIAQLEQERAALRAALAETRQRISQAEASQTVALGHVQAEAAEWHRQTEALTAERAALSRRLERSAQALAAQSERADAESRRAGALAAQCTQLEQTLAATEAKRSALHGDVARGRSEIEALRQQTADRGALAQQASMLGSRVAELEQLLASVRAEAAEADRQRTALAEELQVARHEQAAAATATQREQARMQEALQQVTGERQSLEAETVAQGGELLAQRAEVAELRGGLAERDELIAALRTETETLRQQLADRGLLAQEASELGNKLVELEQLLAQARGETTRSERRRAGLAEELQNLRRQQTDVSAAAQRDQAALHDALQRLSDERTHSEAETTAQAGELQAQRAALAELRTAVTERDEQVATLRAEIEALHEQSADRGVLAHQAAELGRKVVELEQRLATVRGDAAQAQRQRAALAEELEAAQQQHAAAAAAAQQEQAALQAALQQLADERSRLEAEAAAQRAELQSQRTAQDELHATLTQIREAYARTGEEGQDAARRLVEAQQRTEQLQEKLKQRDATVKSGAAERRRLAAQLETVMGELSVGEEALKRAQARYAQERATLEAERDRWSAQAAAARAELDRLAAAAEENERNKAQLEADRVAALSEGAALRQAADHERTERERTSQALRADVVALQAEVERLGSDAAVLRGELAERETHLTTLRRARQSAQQAEETWQRDTAKLRAEVAVLTQQLQEVTAERQQLVEARAAVEQQLALVLANRGEEEQALAGLQAARAQVSQLELERDAVSAALGETRKRVRDVELVHTEAVQHLQADANELRRQVEEATTDRAALQQRLEHVEQEVAAHAARSAEESRRAEALIERCAQFERSLATAEASGTTLGNELAQAHDACARVEQQRAALAHELEATRQTQEERAAAAAQEQAALQGELQRLSAERERLETAQAQRSGESDTQRARLDQLQASVDRAQADRDRARADAEEAGRRIEQMHARVDELAELAQQRDGALHSALDERARFEEAARMAEAIAAELANERDDLRRKAQDAESEIERERASHNAEIEALARDLAHAHESQQPGARSSESLAGDAEAPLDSDEPPVPRFQGPLVIERSAPLGAIMENPAEAPLPPAEEPAPALPASQVQSSGELILLDDGASLDAASTALRGAGIEISVAAPTEATVDALARRKVKCVMLNLGCGPAAWRTLKTLRERVGTRHVPVLAYVMTADAPAGFCFGRADFALWPIEPGRLVERLARLRPKLRRLLAVSADIDGMGRLREPLAQAHVSTSVVLDAKQALEFAAMVDPEAAMLHLSPSCPSAARAIVGLRSSEATRELPLLVLLDKSAGSGEDAFFGVTIRQLVGKAGFQLSSLPEEIARVIG